MTIYALSKYHIAYYAALYGREAEPAWGVKYYDYPLRN